LRIARAANLPAFSWEEIEENPLLKWAINQCIEQEDRQKYERETAIFKGFGQLIRLQDFVATVKAHQIKFDLQGAKSLLGMMDQKRIPRMTIDRSMIANARI
jgi:hypothetical protein